MRAATYRKEVLKVFILKTIAYPLLLYSEFKKHNIIIIIYIIWNFMSVLIVTVLKYKVRSSSCQHHTLVFRYTQLHVTAEKESRYTIQHNHNCNSRKHEWSSETYIYIYMIDKYVCTAVTKSSLLESSYDRKLPITFESLLTSASLIWSSTSLKPRLSLNYSG